MYVGLLIWSCVKQTAWWKHRLSRGYSVRNVYREKNLLLTKSQQEQLQEFKEYPNNPMSLLRVALPCLISIAFTPLAIYLVDVMFDFYFPFSTVRKENINSTLSSFLVPASLVYSLVWGFALQDAFSKFDLTDATTKRHLSVLRHIRELLMRSRAIADSEKAMILQKLATCTIQWMGRQMGKNNECKGRLRRFDAFEH